MKLSVGVLASAVALLLAPIIDSQAAGSDDQEYVQQLHARVSRYSLTAATDKELQLRPQPLLKWGNPVRGFVRAAFLWLSGSRPMAVGTVFVQKDGPHFEFHSLANASIEARFDARRIWFPQQPGLQFSTLKAEDAPGDSATTRSQQMKGIARQFTATMENRRRKSEGRDQLRLLARPLYRYAEPDADLLDGAIFAFTQGTDPEVLLILEAIAGQPSAHWRVAFARLAFNKLEVTHDDAVVWSAPQLRKRPACRECVSHLDRAPG